MLKFDFFALTETWLNDSIFSTELGFNNYNIFRTDRSLNTSSCSRGGGVAICVKNTVLTSEIGIPFNSVEQLFIEVKLSRSYSIVLAACYIPPNSPSCMYSIFIQSIDHVLDKFNNNVKMLVMGNFNLPDVHMFSNSTGLQFLGKHSESADIVFDCFTLNEFNQCNLFFNTSGSLLDLVFSNMTNTFVSLCKNDLLILADTYRPFLCINFEFASDNLISNPIDVSSLDFRKANYTEIICKLNKINWNVLYDCSNIEIAIDVFYKILLDLINEYVPKKRLVFQVSHMV